MIDRCLPRLIGAVLLCCAGLAVAAPPAVAQYRSSLPPGTQHTDVTVRLSLLGGGLGPLTPRDMRITEKAMRDVLDAGYRVGLISNIWHPYLESARRHHGALFEEMARAAPQLFSYCEGIAKPDVRLYERAIAAAACRAEECVMVGDTYAADIAPAMRAGMKAIWLLHRPVEERADLVRVVNGEAPKPTVTVTSIAEVTPSLVSSLFEAPAKFSMRR